MQSKFFSAAVAALAVSSVNAAAVDKRQGNAVVIQPGSIVTPQIILNLEPLSAEAAAYRALDTLRDDLSRNAALVSELNKAVYTNLDAKKAQADAVVRQAQANADAIRTKLESFGATLQGKIPAIPSGGSGGGGGGSGGAPGLPTSAVGVTSIVGGVSSIVRGAVPSAGGAVPSVGAAVPSVGGVVTSVLGGVSSIVGSVPTAAVGGAVSSVVGDAASATSTVIGTVGGIADRVDAVIAQARTLNSQVRSQINQVGSYLEALITPLIGQIKNDSAKAIATSLKQVATSIDTFLAIVQAVAEAGSGTAQSLLARIAAARVSVSPTLVAGISNDVSI